MTESTWKVECQCGQLISEGYGYRATPVESLPCPKRRWWNFWKHKMNDIYYRNKNKQWTLFSTQKQYIF